MCRPLGNCPACPVINLALSRPYSSSLFYISINILLFGELFIFVYYYFNCFQLFAIIVFGCISSGGWYANQCQMSGDSNACGYGTGIGVLAFLFCIGFLVIDALFENISSVQQRKYAVIADLSVSGNYRQMYIELTTKMVNFVW